MKDFRDRFEQQLIAAARREDEKAVTAAKIRFSSWYPPRSVIFVSAVVLAGGTAVAATHPWSPLLGDPRFEGPPPTVAPDTPPRDQLKALEVLRREQTPQDRSLATRGTLRYISGSSTRGVRTDYIRQLIPAGAGTVTLVPVASWRPNPAAPPVHDALCVFYGESGSDGGARTCWTTDQVLQGNAVAELGNHFYGLVPDGVAIVLARFSDGTSTSASVRDNFFDLASPPDMRDPEHASVGARPSEISWLDSNATTVGPPSRSR
jgi:hypothetical protein